MPPVPRDMTTAPVKCPTYKPPAGKWMIVMDKAKAIASFVGIGLAVVLIITICICCKCNCKCCCKCNVHHYSHP